MQELEAAGAVGAKQGGAESQFNCCINGDALARQSQLGGGAARGGCSQCSREGLGVTQPHSLSGLRVVLEGLGLGASASPIVGYDGHNSWVLRHQGWGEGNDPAAVDCWHGICCPSYHCLQRFRQFELSVNIAGGKATTQLCHLVCMRAGGKVVASCSAGRWAAWAAGGGGFGVGSSRSANGGVRSCKLQEAAAEPAQPVTIIVCAGRWGLGLGGGGGGGRTGLSGEKQGRELAEWRNQGSELAKWRMQSAEGVG